MLKNFFSISKNQVSVLTTLVVIIILASGYFFIYMPGNEKALQAQRFRALQHVDRNVHEKIENSAALLNNLLTNYQQGNDKEKATVLNYILKYPSKNFTLIKPEKLSIDKTMVWQNNADSICNIIVDSVNRQITLHLIKQQVNNNDSTIFQIGMKFNFNQFIEFLLPGNVFDEYIVFSNSKPVYESFPSGISYMVKDSLFTVRTGISSSLVVNHNISGTDYKMFLQSISLNAKSELVVTGLLSNSRYQQEKNRLPTTIILLLVTILFTIIVAFPWIKLYQMGSKDRLTLTDGISSMFISMLLMSLLFFIFFKYNLPLRSGETKDSKAILANGISTAFKKEIELAYTKINVFDSLIKATSTLQTKDIIHLGKNTSFSDDENTLADPLKKNINAISKGLSINQVFWLDGSGHETNNWSIDAANAPHGYYNHREYFKNIINQRSYLLNNNNNKPYYLEQVTSWTTGVFTTVISIPSSLSTDTNRAVAAISVKMKSLDSVLLPTGYLFAIIDNSGKVLYHSEKSKNLNENLLNEFSENETLRSYLEAKSPGVFSTKYFSKKYNVLVKPMTGLPYFIIIFGDTIFKETRDAEIYSFTISMLILFFGFLVLQLLAVFLVSARRSFFKNQLFDTSWIGPKISCHREYVLAALFNIITILMLFISFAHSAFLQYFFMLLFSVTFMPFFLNGIFALRYQQEKKNVLQYKKTALWCLGILMILITAGAFHLLDNWHFIFLLIYQLLLIAFSILLYYYKEPLFNYCSIIKNKLLLFRNWKYVNSFTVMGLTRLIATSGIPIVFFYYSSYNYEQNLSTRYKHTDFLNKLCNKIPAGDLDSVIKNNTYPPGIYLDSSWVAGISITEKEKINTDYKASYSPEYNNTIQYLKQFRLYITDIAVAEDKFYSPYAADSSFFFNHLLDDAGSNEKGTVTSRPSYRTHNYIQVKSASLNYQFPTITGFQKNNFFKGLLFWGLLLAALFVFYFVIYSIIKKLFALQVPDLSLWRALDNKILTDKNLNKLVFIIGLPGAGKKYHIINKINRGEILLDEKDKTPFVYNEEDETYNNVFIADLINIPDNSGDDKEQAPKWEEFMARVFNKKHRLIIVNHFEYNIQDPISNRRKLNFLERLTLENHCKIIILSTIHPVAFLDSVISQPLKKEDDKTTGIPGEDLERWHVLLGHYRIVLLPLDLIITTEKMSKLQVTIEGRVCSTKGGAISNATIMVKNTIGTTLTDSNGRFQLGTHHQLPFILVIKASSFITEEVTIQKNHEPVEVQMEEAFYNWKDRIRAETHYTHFLKAIKQQAIDVAANMPERERMTKSDELAFKLQVTSHYFYMYIWQSLTKEEKFLLYDLAEDNLVNSFDDYNLSMLVGKGIIVRTDGTLKLFNKGFRNFILTAIGNTEAMKIKNQIKDNGNWSKLKNPLQIVIVAILAFLLTSQEESYSKIITYLAALGAGVPTVLKLFSIFEKSGDKQS